MTGIATTGDARAAPLAAPTHRYALGAGATKSGMVALGEHYRPVDETQPPGIYRVVGTPDDVTLLGVADASGRRHTGQLVHVSETTIDADFEPAGDPAAGLRPVSRVRNQLQGLYWTVRRFL